MNEPITIDDGWLSMQLWTNSVTGDRYIAPMGSPPPWERPESWIKLKPGENPFARFTGNGGLYEPPQPMNDEA